MHTLDEIKQVNLENYHGSSSVVYGLGGYNPELPNNNIIEFSDTRELLPEKALKLKQLKLEATKDIEANAPQYKQINAALGLYSTEETEVIQTVIIQARLRMDSLEAALCAAKTLDEVALVVWKD
jgi:hypothetical protein